MGYRLLTHTVYSIFIFSTFKLNPGIYNQRFKKKWWLVYNKGRCCLFFRRNSLDIFTAEYSVKMAQGNKVDSLQQKTAFHMKVRNIIKEFKFWFSNPNIFAMRGCRPLIFQTINFVRSNMLSLKYQRFTLWGCKDIGLRKCVLVAKTQ